jgi:VanZ family protein
MPPLRWTRGRWRAVFVAGALALLPLALMPFEMDKKSGFAHGDKVAHIIAFACLAYTAARGWPQRTRVIVLTLAAYGVAIELLQALTPLRSASLSDVAADIVGVAVGLALARGWMRARARV